MNIKAEKIILEMSQDEFWFFTWAIKVSLENDLKNHWVRHQSNWKANEKQKLEFLEKAYSILGRLDVYEQIFRLADAEFKEYNENNES